MLSFCNVILFIFTNTTSGPLRDVKCVNIVTAIVVKYENK